MYTNLKHSYHRYLLLTTLIILALIPVISNSTTAQMDSSKKSSSALASVPGQRVHSYKHNGTTPLLATDQGLFIKAGVAWQQLLAAETFAVEIGSQGHLWAATREGIRLSLDQGQSWQLANKGIPSGAVPLSIEATLGDQRLYIGTDHHGIMRSDDAGSSWQPISQGLPPSIGAAPFAAIKRIRVAPTNPDLVFASTDARGLYWSNDGGQHWQVAALGLGAFSFRTTAPFVSFDEKSAHIYALVSFPINSELIEHSIYRSADSGKSWQIIGKLTPNQMLYDFSVSGNSAQVVSAKGTEKLDLDKLAQQYQAAQQAPDDISPKLTIPGTEADFEQDNISILHDDGTFVSFGTSNITNQGAQIAKRFYQRHGDEYDIIVIYLDPSYILPFTGGAIAYNAPVSNQVLGIGRDVGAFNGGNFAYGSSKQLRAFCHMNNLNGYSPDPNAAVTGTYSALDLLAHQVGHTWGAYTYFDDNGVTSDELLGFGLAHWSFFFNSDASDLQGNTYQDLGNSQFRTSAASSKFNSFDTYAMGIGSNSSTQLYIVSNPTKSDPPLQVGSTVLDVSQPQIRGLQPIAPPEGPALTITGTRKNVSLAQIITAEGARIPAQETGNLRMAFVLPVAIGNEPDPDAMRTLKAIMKAWPGYFNKATGGLRSVDLTAIARNGSDTTPPKLKLKSPAGGEVIPAGTTINISWDSSDENGLAKQDILLSLDDGKTYPITVASKLNGFTQLFDYTIPTDLASDTVRIKIVCTDYAGNVTSDNTKVAFSIQRETTPPVVKVATPNGGEHIVAGSNYLIQWNSIDNGMLATHDINLSLDGGKTFNKTIISGISGRTQSFIWQVPQDLTATDARIEVVAKDSVGNVGRDASDKSFTIDPVDKVAPTVRLFSPIGTELVQAGGTFNITWSSSDNVRVDSQELSLSTDGGNTFDTIIASGLSGSTNNFVWSVPNIEITTARIRITAFDAQNNNSSDISRSNFTITKQDVTAPLVTVTSPNGGEIARAGEPLVINWQSSDNVAISSHRISLSLDSGKTFPISAITGLPGSASSFTFMLPNTLVSNSARIKVEAIDSSNFVGADISDSDFTITGKDLTSPIVKVLSPNGGEILANDQPLRISWQSSDNLAVVSQDIQISTDGGSTYTTLKSGLAASVQDFVLDVTTLTSERAKIKIIARDSQNNMGADDSDNSFVLAQRPTINNAKYSSADNRLILFVVGVSAQTSVEINGQTINLPTKFKAKKGTLTLKGTLSSLKLNSGDNVIILKERGLVSGAYKLNLP